MNEIVYVLTHSYDYEDSQIIGIYSIYRSAKKILRENIKCSNGLHSNDINDYKNWKGTTNNKRFWSWKNEDKTFSIMEWKVK